MSRGENSCRACGRKSLRKILNLGETPIANYLPDLNSDIVEPSYPLNLVICAFCKLGQIGEFQTPSEIFSDYPYLSSTSSYWTEHAKNFAQEAIETISNLKESYVLEVASNDGYLLEKFLKNGIKVLGVDPSRNVTPIAEAKGVETIVGFFGKELAQNILNSFGAPKLIIANNVAAHVPDMVDFFGGIEVLCDKESLVSVENPTFGTLLENNLYDTVYHEHFSYLSVDSIDCLAGSVGLELFKVESLPTHGGSFRYWLRKPDGKEIYSSVAEYSKVEENKGLGNRDKELVFAKNVKKAMRELHEWVNAQPDSSISGYGAAAKTVTMFHAAELNPDKFKHIVDANVLKQGRRLPGTYIPILDPDELRSSTKVLIFPWNLSVEIAQVIRSKNANAEIWVPNPLRRLD